MNFTRGNFKPGSASSILQAFYYRVCLVHLSIPSKLVISKKWKPKIALLVHNARWLFSDGSYRQKSARLALSEMRPTLFGKIPGFIFELNETQKNPGS